MASAAAELAAISGGFDELTHQLTLLPGQLRVDP
jgi:hypothetical protein